MEAWQGIALGVLVVVWCGALGLTSLEVTLLKREQRRDRRELQGLRSRIEDLETSPLDAAAPESRPQSQPQSQRTPAGQRL